ncbi:class I SAM-dependent methyltransferase [Solidesulfovibrio sp.]
MDEDAARFDARAAAWDANAHRRKLARNIVTAMAQTGIFARELPNVLDFGCGTGLLTLELADRAGHVTGLDTSPGMLAELSAKLEQAGLGNVSVLQADLAAGDPLPGSYDLITSAMALHHLPDPAVVLKRLFAVANPGAHLALADLDAEGGRFHDDNAGVYHHGFDRIDLADMLAGIGFTGIAAATAATIEKAGKNGLTVPFTVFLMTARKPASCCAPSKL